MLVELEDPSQQKIFFMEMRPNQRRIQEVSIYNNSKVPIIINFDINNQLMSLNDLSLSISQKSLVIEARRSSKLSIVYHPTDRHRVFSQMIQYQVNENSELFELLTIIGSCESIELKIIEQRVDFFEAVINSSISQSITVVNQGDLNALYTWDLGFMDKFFRISPSNGTILANQ